MCCILFVAYGMFEYDNVSLNSVKKGLERNILFLNFSIISSDDKICCCFFLSEQNCNINYTFANNKYDSKTFIFLFVKYGIFLLSLYYLLVFRLAYHKHIVFGPKLVCIQHCSLNNCINIANYTLLVILIMHPIILIWCEKSRDEVLKTSLVLLRKTFVHAFTTKHIKNYK